MKGEGGRKIEHHPVFHDFNGAHDKAALLAVDKQGGEGIYRKHQGVTNNNNSLRMEKTTKFQ